MAKTAGPDGRNRYEENAKIVLVVKVWPAARVVDGKDGSFGESGKC
jgi:hypothetical protein